MQRSRRMVFSLMLVLVGCASSSTAVRDPGHKDRTYTRVLVLANFKSLSWRKDAETALVRKLKRAHIDSASSLEFAIDLDDSAKKRIVEAGFDCILEVQAGPNAGIMYSNVTAILHDIRDWGTAWQDEVEARSATNWTAEATVIDGMEQVAEDLIASGVLSKKSKPGPKPTTTKSPRGDFMTGQRVHGTSRFECPNSRWSSAIWSLEEGMSVDSYVGSI